MSILIKTVAVVVVLAVGVFIAGVSGALFAVWPTSWPDQPLRVTASELTALRHLQAEPKFQADSSLFYPGAANEATRLSCEALINHFLSDLIDNLESTPRKARVLATLKTTLAAGSRLDSEDQDRLSLYLQQTLAILDIKGSNELINVWRYGFPYGWFTGSSSGRPHSPR